MLKFKRINVNLFFIIFLAAFSYFAGGRYALVSISFALLHELGHIVAITAMRKKINCINIDFFRINIDICDEMSLTEDFVCALCGPLVNLVMFIIFTSLNFYHFNKMYIFISMVNIFIFILNMFPIYPLDGGRMFKCIIFTFTSYEKMITITRIVSFVSLMLLFSAALYCIHVTGYNISLLIIFVFLFINLFIKNPELY